MEKRRLDSVGVGLRRLIEEEPFLAWIASARRGLPEAEWFVVGGTVRDALLGRNLGGDVDLLVRGVTIERAARWLAERGEVDWVGRRFGVLKFRPSGCRETVDIAWPRTERAGMSGAYRDFEVSYDPELPVEADLGRRDFTVNALAWRVADGQVVDTDGGLADLEAGCLRAVGDPGRRFREDLSRVLRGVRFACELGFDVEPATWEAMRAAAPRLGESAGGVPLVPVETVARGTVKAMVADPSRAANLLSASGALGTLVPELTRLRNVPQPPEWHDEGDAWMHTCLALGSFGSPQFAEFFPGKRPSALAVMAVLFHDIGKTETMKVRDGRLTFWGHAETGAHLTRQIAERLRLANAGVDPTSLAWLVREHMFSHLVDLDEVKKTTLASRFLDDPELGEALLQLYFADVAASWRPSGGPDFTHFNRLLAEVRRLGALAAKPLLSGEEVMAEAGLVPGPEVGHLIEAIREGQLHGRLETAEEAREFIKALGTRH
jgi:poly(A) polymerase